jgi:type II restriction/modification system DNA methylase subunit YeeA
VDSLQFVKKWAASAQSERATAQEHFIDLCRLVGESTPNEADPTGDFYAFEKGAKRPDGDGFADVWLKNHFAWEYKGKHKDLGIAYKQVQTYREALGNPPLLVVSDIETFEVHTNWTSTETWIYHFRNADIALDEPVEVTTYGGPAADAPRLTALQVLKALFGEPERLKPLRTTEQITQEAAKLFGRITDDLRKWKVDDMRIARFVTRVMFCMFATDVGLLPRETFSEVINVNKNDPAAFRENLSALFGVMAEGGKFLMHPVPYFNGRLFDDTDVPGEIHGEHVRLLEDLNDLNWADVEPSIFGTLFERVIDPAQRRQIGAHYTSRADIELIVQPVLMAPLEREWERVEAAVEELANGASSKGLKPETLNARIAALLEEFHNRLATIRILDPACGSGNFLYVSLALLKALEKKLIAFAASYDVHLAPRVHPQQLRGIETSAYARELASIVIWIGYLQWKHRNMISFEDESPILQPLDQIELRDAIVDLSDQEHPAIPDWPEADVVVGNPPFLGGKLLRRHLGDEYVDKLFAAWDGQVARESDLCCYWFEQGRRAIVAGRAKRVGLLATQGIRGGANRRVLQRIKETGDIFYAQADRKWIQDGVAVRVSMVGFDDGSDTQRLLNEGKDDDPKNALARARPVPTINANLTCQADVTKARRLKENLGISFQGDTKVGPFEIPEAFAKRFLATPSPHGKPNSDVVRPWVNGLDITRRPRRMWIIDFPPGMSEEEAALYEAPFEYINEHVRPFRKVARSGDVTGVPWWVHQRPRPDMREALEGLSRYIATPLVSKHRIFAWLPPEVLAENLLVVFARDNDYFFGVLHSRVHQVWALLMGTQLESRPRYTPTSCFETFPSPHPSPEQEAAIAEAARELDALRQNWLNPPEGSLGPKELKKRTLTNLYNERPTWLANAHRKLDEAVFEAYGWPETPDELPDGEIVARLLALNLQREPV